MATRKEIRNDWNRVATSCLRINGRADRGTGGADGAARAFQPRRQARPQASSHWSSALFGEAAAAVSSGSATAAPARNVLNAYVGIHPDNAIVLFAKNPDCGQGIKTTFGMILAEELDADWNQVRVEQAQVGPAYGTQSSGGSNSTPTNWDELRRAGATARAMLVNAAAARWQGAGGQPHHP